MLDRQINKFEFMFGNKFVCALLSSKSIEIRGFLWSAISRTWTKYGPGKSSSGLKERLD